jgi:hypothetical protein
VGFGAIDSGRHVLLQFPALEVFCGKLILRGQRFFVSRGLNNNSRYAGEIQAAKSVLKKRRLGYGV